jgi:hypothetical protein
MGIDHVGSSIGNAIASDSSGAARAPGMRPHLWWSIEGVLPLGLVTSSRAPLDRAPRLGLGLAIRGDDRGDARRLSYSALLDRRASRTGEWLGLSSDRGADAGTRLHLGSGVWHSFKPVQVEIGLVSSIIPTREQQADHWAVRRDSRDTLSWVDTTTFHAVDQTVVNTTVQSTLRWQFGRAEISAIGGVVVRDVGAPHRWAQANIDVRATRQLMVIAAFGQRPTTSLAFEPSAGPRTMLGVRLAPLAPRHDAAITHVATPYVRKWTTLARPEGRVAIRVRCLNATSVELTGDFTDWAPLMLTAQGGGWWGCEIAIPSGLHQVQVRLDGGVWQAPPGLPTTQGDFAGTAGVLLIE